MKAKRRTPVSVILAAVTLCLVLVSAHFASGMFARYIVQANGEDEARIAEFDVSAQAPTENPITIIANGTDDSGKAEYTVKVKNNSETPVRYEAAVIFDHEEDADKFDGDLTFSGNLAPDEEDEKTLVLDMSAYFETNDKYSTFSNDDMSGNKGKAPFDVTVKFTQID